MRKPPTREQLDQKNARQRAKNKQRRVQDPDFSKKGAARAKRWRDGLTEEEKARVRGYHKDYQKERYATDAKYRAKRALAVLVSNNKRYKTDPVFRALCKQRGLRARLAKFGCTLEAYADALVAQDFKCAICNAPLDTTSGKTAADHCHKTGKFRAVLCVNCNLGLGHFKDNPQTLRDAAEYLELFQDRQ